MKFDYSALEKFSDIGPSSNTLSLGNSIIIGIIVIVLSILIINNVFLTLVFKKANHDHPWAAWVPIYRQWVYFQITGLPGWLGLILVFSIIIPGLSTIINMGLTAVRSYKLSKAFGKDVGYAIGLYFLQTIFLGIFALGNHKYIDPYENNAK